MTNKNEGRPEPSRHKVQKHKRFYFDNITIRVENELFSVPLRVLKEASPVFESMVIVGRGDQGKTDDDPVVLEGQKSKDFESLLKVIFPDYTDAFTGLSLTEDEWIGVLNLSTMWEMSQIREGAIERLSAMQLGALKRITLAKQYRISLWLSEGIETLVKDFENYAIEDIAHTLGWEKAARLADTIARRGSDFIHKSRVTCHKCKGVLKSAEQIHCQCGEMYEQNFNFIIASLDSKNKQGLDALAVGREVFADELKNL
ncbi:hypothetical protein BKA70DRAFT_1280097 [Coprinopsis sp. MPI-PUGE-AT-0042]|nr:hypothetical protein BKA70DRAFT_1280097 [Coprinopsis sp. MPI-PUGE-AT-0042]